MRRETDFIVVKEETDICPCTMIEIDKKHRRQGWLKVGYHYVITEDGQIQKGRDVGQAGGHTRGLNHCSIGVGLCGSSHSDLQLDALKDLVIGLVCRYPQIEVINHPSFIPHGNLGAFDAEIWWKNILSLI
jgi:N-acetyl-anhydromuramyl-L-alanine amidase AmpD